MEKNKTRSIAIDAYRAIVMLLMIFVNDTWTLINIPSWIGHLPADQDGLGLADVVFPAFLFIVGLSLPFAIRSRQKKGDSPLRIAQHIVLRAIALIVMGVLYVNLESYPADAYLPYGLWQILITIGFFLIWLNYAHPDRIPTKLLKGIGIALLLVLVFLFKGKTAPWWHIDLQIHWWGILGIIGWSYLLIGLLFLFSNGLWWAQLSIFILLVLFNMGAQSPVFDYLSSVKDHLWIISDGSAPALVAAGVCLSLLYQNHRNAQPLRFIYAGLTIGLGLLLLGQLSREFWMVSKIRSTPSFTLICAGISTIAFVAMVVLTDRKRWTSWYRWISPAGTSTLTCYLLPYLHYGLLGFITYRLPEWVRTGELGILKSLVYALVIITIAGWLERRRLNLKL
ncbi:MAG: DUF5009 domain-containing protein [Sphingobacterium sp.]